MSMKPEELQAIGEAIYGSAWRSGLARDLGIGHEGKIAQMADGKRRIPEGFRDDLEDVIKAKLDGLAIALRILGEIEPAENSAPADDSLTQSTAV